MRDSLRVSDQASVQATHPKQPKSKLGLRGKFKVEHWFKGVKISEHEFPNGITNEGKDAMLDAMFNSGSQYTFYMGLIDNSPSPTLAAADTYDGIGDTNGWTEFTDYTDGNNGDNAGTRPEWQSDAASGQAVTNSTLAIFDITDTGTVHGLFIAGGANAQTKSDSTSSGNVLWATAPFATGNEAVSNGSQLKVTYTVDS